MKYGKYVCVTDRAVGFQSPEGKPEHRFAGAIELAPERQRFFVTIRKIEKPPTPNYDRPKSVSDPNLSFYYNCSQESFAKLKETILSDLGGRSGSIGRVEEFYEICLARSTAEVSDGGLYPRIYYSTGENVFTDRRRDRFFITRPPSTFRWNFSNYAGGEYMAEGRCDFVE